MQVLLYVLGKLDEKERSFHKVFKILWFADIAHIKKYGRSITGDAYIKMELGPVPSFLYDVFKGVKNGIPPFNKYSQNILVQGHGVKPLKEADLDYLSVSDIEELDNSIRENSILTMGQLIDKSHGIAWEKSIDNKKIYLENILDELNMQGEEREAVLEMRAFAEAFT
jgi:uncharacterized phage-associated protein